MPINRVRPVKKALARVAIRPPVRASNGAVTIKNSFDGQARVVRAVPLPLQYRTVINWGNAAELRGLNPQLYVLNKPAAVQQASNKLLAFRKFAENNVRCPSFQTEKPVLKKGVMYLARQKLCGSSGDGIKILRNGDEVVDAPLYVKYIPKLVEYRVHVAGDRVIFAQQKKRKADGEQTEDQKLIRNYDNGWVFCPVNVAELNEDVNASARAAVAGLGLDFGAVDLIIGRDDGLAYILEVNTAPGLSSPGLIQAYRDRFKEMIRV